MKESKLIAAKTARISQIAKVVEEEHVATAQGKVKGSYCCTI